MGRPPEDYHPSPPWIHLDHPGPGVYTGSMNTVGDIAATLIVGFTLLVLAGAIVVVVVALLGPKEGP